jgi:type IV pilus assembly protein PilA
MRACPYCAETIEDHAQVCPFCNTNLFMPAAAPGVPGMPPPGGPQTSGKAVASLICGILSFFFPAAIVAVIMGHLSLSDIRRSAGRLSGRGMAIAGLVLGYLGLAVLPVLIIAAIAIPNLLRSRMAANEAAAMGSLRTLNMACITYSSQYNSYPPSLSSLGPSTQPSSAAAGLISDALASGQKSGYQFTYEAQPDAKGAISTFILRADPITEGSSGQRHFFVDQSGVIHASIHGPATEDSPPIM